MPFSSDAEAPACCTASRKPSTCSTLALSTISRSVSRASDSESRMIMKPFRPNFTVRSCSAAVALMTSSCSVTPSKSLPLEK